MSNILNPKVSEKSFKEHIHSIVANPFNAIVELIANAHDAGATELYIYWSVDILNNEFAEIKFKDNGCGMSNDEFKEIWVELSYDRFKNADGDKVKVITDSGDVLYRNVYGKNGKGRHAPLAFSNKYKVETIKNGQHSIFEIAENSIYGFTIREKECKSTDEKNGTTISFNINKIENNISIEDIKETIATRFLKDANFKIYLNNEIIELKDISKENKSEFKCNYKNNDIKVIKIKSNTNSSYMKFHGISWKFGNRIFCEDWDNVLDGRLRIAKQYNFIISADFLSEYVNETISGFKDTPDVKDIKKVVYDCIKKSLNNDLEKERNNEKKDIIRNNFNSIKKLGIIDKKDIIEFINEVQEKCPNIKPDDLKATAEIFIKLKESHNNYDLLHSISKLSSSEMDDLDEIIKKWDIGQAKYVLDLIQERLNFIETLEKKMDDPTTDELHELQVLFSKGLWIFGPDYESIEFTSNKSLKNVVKKLFKQETINLSNPYLRPDFVVLPDGNINIYSSDSFDDDGEVNGIDRLLIIELKKGGSKIDVNAKAQVEIYIMELFDGNYINDNAKIDAYVLGSTVKAKKSTIMDDRVSIIPMSYSVIVRRAEKRLFNLRNKIKSIKNISEKTGDKIFDEMMSQDSLDSYVN